MICYKNAIVEQAAAQMRRDPRLSIIVSWLHDEFPDKIIITESWRPARHPGDLHSMIPYRAVDLRSWVFDFPEAVADRINSVWVYDPQRPKMKVCVYHKVKKSAYHFHIQVYHNTIRRVNHEDILQASGRHFDLPVGGVATGK